MIYEFTTNPRGDIPPYFSVATKNGVVVEVKPKINKLVNLEIHKVLQWATSNRITWKLVSEFSALK